MSDLIPLIYRAGTAALWAERNPVLAANEPGLEKDTRRMKYGDGETAWSALPYAIPQVPLLRAQRVAVGVGFVTLGPGFSTVAIPAAQADTTGGYDPATGIYSVAESGEYLVVGSLRLLDGTPPGISYAIGVDAAGDGSGALWVTTSTASRQGASYSRIVAASAGQQLRLYTYIDTPGGAAIDGAELYALRIA